MSVKAGALQSVTSGGKRTSSAKPGRWYVAEALRSSYLSVSRQARAVLAEAALDGPEELIARSRRFVVVLPQPRIADTGRNDPCPCGSGKKYKHCHGA